MACERVLTIDGKQEPCVVIPMRYAGFKRTKEGNPFIMLSVLQSRISMRGNTHFLKVMQPNMAALREVRKLGISPERKVGFMRPHIADKSKKVDRRNKMTPISCVGSICLSDIPEEYIHTDRMTGKKYLNCNLLFKWMEYQDSFGNTHELSLSLGESELHLGYFKEDATETNKMRIKQITEDVTTEEEVVETEELPATEPATRFLEAEDEDDEIIIGGFKF